MRKDGKPVHESFGGVPARYLQNYDGDTFKADIDEWPAIIGEYVSVRIAGIDAPEMYIGTAIQNLPAERSRIALGKLLGSSKAIVLSNVKRGKFFRIVATVFADGVNVGGYMISHGYAKKKLPMRTKRQAIQFLGRT